MNKFLLPMLVLVVLGGTLAWFNRADLVLAAAKFRSSQDYAGIAPTRNIPWQQGPASPTVPANERPPILS